MATLMAPKPARLKTLRSIARTSVHARSSRTASSTSLKPWHTTRQPSRPSTTSRIPSTPALLASSTHRRHASTAPTASPQSTSEDILTWDRFFNLRRKRRYLNLGSSVVTAGTAIGAFGPIIASQDLDGWAAGVMGLDPIMVLAATTFAVATMGWLCGPSFGTAVFKVWAGRRNWNQPIAEKEKSFFERIRRYRADPSSSSPQNPIPDYYGEKIASVKDYRRWLKDQRAFNMKKNKNMF